MEKAEGQRTGGGKSRGSAGRGNGANRQTGAKKLEGGKFVIRKLKFIYPKRVNTVKDEEKN